jgi:hypothetical protein
MFAFMVSSTPLLEKEVAGSMLSGLLGSSITSWLGNPPLEFVDWAAEDADDADVLVTEVEVL